MRIRILLVDDEKDFIEALAQRLEIRGFQIFTASSGIDAINMISVNEIDVIIMDVKMPGMEGMEALAKIKSLKPLVEIVMLTAHGSLGEAISAMKMGAHDFLMKPASIETIIEKINSAYDIKTAQEERIKNAKSKITD